MSVCRAAVIVVAWLQVSCSVDALVTGGNKDDPKKAPEYSKLIKGPDCGHVKQIIGKYQKAAKVGKVAGAARGVITQADVAAGKVDVAVSRAKEIGKSLTKDGELPKAIKEAIANAEKAAKEASKASAALDTELETFKTKVSGSDISGADVKDEDLVKLKKAAEAAKDAGGAAFASAERVISKAEETEKEVKVKSRQSAGRVRVLISQAEPLLEKLPKAAQEAGWAVDKADATAKKADDTLKKVDDKIKDAKDQKPVFEALKDGIKGQVKGVEEMKEPMKKATTGVSDAEKGLKEAMEPLNKAAKKAAGGGVVTEVSEDLTKAEKAIDEAKQALAALKGKQESLVKAQDRLKAALEKAEKKVA